MATGVEARGVVSNRIVDAKGERFGSLVGIRQDGRNRRGSIVWLCRCDCGTKVRRTGSFLKTAAQSGKLTSCGCHRGGRPPLGMSPRPKDKSLLPLYWVWLHMHQRCGTPGHPYYHRYGGRGIKVCKRWWSFQKFLADMGPRPEGYLLDRKNNDRGYSPRNCRWASPLESTRNRGNSILVKHAGKTQSLKEWAHEFGVPYSVVYNRHRRTGSVVLV